MRRGNVADDCARLHGDPAYNTNLQLTRITAGNGTPAMDLSYNYPAANNNGGFSRWWTSERDQVMLLTIS